MNRTMFFKVTINVTLILLLLAAHSIFLYGQAPTIVPVSPEATALTKEVNYPISPNLGLAGISIPLTQIESGGMVLPIALNYHSGGFKTNELATSVGLGFSLSCDLQITRSINGLDDLEPNTGYAFNSRMNAYVTGANPVYSSYFHGLYGSALRSELRGIGGSERQDVLTPRPNIDAMPDKFSYRLINKSGSFYFRRNQAGNGYTIVTVPYDNTLKIIYDGGNNYSIGSFTIIDSDGTTYTFGLGDSFKEKQIENPYFSAVTTWKCKRIENATKTASFDFTYAAKSPVQIASFEEQIEVKDYVDACVYSAYYPYRSVDYVLAQSPYLSSGYAEEIVNKGIVATPIITTYFPDGKRSVSLFSPSSSSHFKSFNFRDGYGASVSPKTSALVLSSIAFRGGSVVFSGTDQLDYMQVLDVSGAAVKTFDFIQSLQGPAPWNLAAAKFFNGDGFQGTLYLDGIEIKSGALLIEKYGLQYDRKYCFGNHLVGKDAWGYPNDNTQEVASSSGIPSGIPLQHLEQSASSDAEPLVPCSPRQVAFDIGNTRNTEVVTSSTRYYGMLSRIMQSTGGYTDFQFEPNKYQVDGAVGGVAVRSGGGYRIKSVTYYDGKSYQAAWQKYYRYGELEDGIGEVIRTPDNKYDLTDYHFEGFSYNRVSTFLGKGAVEGYDTKVTYYEPASSRDYNYQNGAFIYYTKVTEYNSDLGVSTGKKVYTYYAPNQFQQVQNREAKIAGTNLNVLHTDGLMGQQRSVEEYKYEKGGYSLLHSKAYTYQKKSQSEQIKVVYVYLKKSYSFDDGGYISGDFGDHPMPVWVPYWAETRREDYLTSHVGDTYQYGEYGLEVASVLPLTETETWVREGTPFTQTKTYYYDNPAFLQASRFVTTNSKGEQLTTTLKYAYDFTDGVYPQMNTKNMISMPVEQIEFNNTLGKEISRVKTNYGIIAPLTMITPVSLQKSYNGTALKTELTYDKYDEYGNLIQLTGKNRIPVTYLWGYNKLYPIAEVVGATYDQVANVNASVRHADLLTTTDHTSILAGMNERRSLLPSAYITSFTHKALVGILNKTDPSGQIITYDYDPGGRLRQVWDKENLLKSYDYNLINKAAGYNPPWYSTNIPQMETYYAICTSNSRNMQVPFNYVVPGGKYTSETGAWYELQNAEHSTPPDLNCSSYESINMAKVSIVSRGIAGAHLDLIQNGSVVYSKTFNENFTTPEGSYVAKDFYVPAGEYTLSLRLEFGNSYGPVRMNWDTGSSYGSLREVSNGETLKLEAGNTNWFEISEVTN